MFHQRHINRSIFKRSSQSPDPKLSEIRLKPFKTADVKPQRMKTGRIVATRKLCAVCRNLRERPDVSEEAVLASGAGPGCRSLQLPVLLGRRRRIGRSQHAPRQAGCRPLAEPRRPDALERRVLASASPALQPLVSTRRSRLRRRGVRRFKPGAVLPVLRCRGRHYGDAEPTLPRSFVWLLQLFSFTLDVEPCYLFEEVLEVERRVFGNETALASGKQIVGVENRKGNRTGRRRVQ